MFEKLMDLVRETPTEKIVDTAVLERAAARAKGWEVFLAYHEHSDWAKAVAELDRAPLTKEAITYMEREIEGRKARKAAFDAWEKDFQNAQRSPETPAAEPTEQRIESAAVVGGAEQPGHSDG